MTARGSTRRGGKKGGIDCMETHVVTVCAKRFFRVYVEDKHGDMNTEEILEKAKKNLLAEIDPNTMIDPELELEPDDILSAEYEYELDD